MDQLPTSNKVDINSQEFKSWAVLALDGNGDWDMVLAQHCIRHGFVPSAIAAEWEAENNRLQHYRGTWAGRPEYQQSGVGLPSRPPSRRPKAAPVVPTNNTSASSPRHYWTDEETKTLTRLLAEGHGMKHVAAQLGMSNQACGSKKYRDKIPGKLDCEKDCCAREKKKKKKDQPAWSSASTSTSTSASASFPLYSR